MHHTRRLEEESEKNRSQESNKRKRMRRKSTSTPGVIRETRDTHQRRKQSVRKKQINSAERSKERGEKSENGNKLRIHETERKKERQNMTRLNRLKQPVQAYCVHCTLVVVVI